GDLSLDGGHRLDEIGAARMSVNGLDSGSIPACGNSLDGVDGCAIGEERARAGAVWELSALHRGKSLVRESDALSGSYLRGFALIERFDAQAIGLGVVERDTSNAGAGGNNDESSRRDERNQLLARL